MQSLKKTHVIIVTRVSRDRMYLLHLENTINNKYIPSRQIQLGPASMTRLFPVYDNAKSHALSHEVETPQDVVS